jgi:uncharacterized membrane protein YqjE
MGLSWLMPFMGVLAAIGLSAVFWILDANAALQVVLVIGVFLIVAKLTITWGVQLVPRSGSLQDNENDPGNT